MARLALLLFLTATYFAYGNNVKAIKPVKFTKRIKKLPLLARNHDPVQAAALRKAKSKQLRLIADLALGEPSDPDDDDRDLSALERTGSSADFDSNTPALTLEEAAPPSKVTTGSTPVIASPGTHRLLRPLAKNAVGPRE